MSGTVADPSDDFPEYVAECDEHLSAARARLLAGEVDPATLDRAALDALFRDFHTVKGLSGMVGVREAEDLAHAVETYLGAVRRDQSRLTAGAVAVLLDAVQGIEGVIAARRDGRPAPPVEGLAARLAALRPVAAARRVWQVTFAPTSELAARGRGVNEVRDQLKAAGEIVRAEPVVTPGAGVSFRFLVASVAADFAERVAGDGVTVEPQVAAESPAAEETSGTSPSLSASNLVRVDLGRLDDLMRAVGELVITRARLENGLGRVAGGLAAGDRRDLEETSLLMERQLRDLREGVMRVRLVQVRDVFARMRLVARDAARETGKSVHLELVGEGTEVDKYVVERLADPLLHLVRNAVSHGLEGAGERAAAGKPADGRLTLRAAAAGGAIEIQVADDGRGIDADRVLARARALGLPVPDGPADAGVLLDVLCTPGFSTRDTADRASGRGVGMDVVRRAIEDLGGTLAVDTGVGVGTTFTARLPLTLAIADALIVAVDGQTFAVPQTAVREVVEIDPAATVAFENNELLRRHGGVVPLVRLADLFGAARPAGRYPALVLGDGRQAVALGVDRVLGLREVVVRPLADPLVQVPGLAGATELGDGRAVLILDAGGLARVARGRRPGGRT
ncbi:MAG TPA: chemotaxis protein CheA [Gemmataceae bacterium]|nr:chemotaxis protein CheA [Gemmataceae bacterium]